MVWSRRMRCAQSASRRAASAKGLRGSADPGLGDARQSGADPAQAGLTGACRGETIGGGGPASHCSTATRRKRCGANEGAGSSTCAHKTRRAETGRREPRADGRTGAKLRRTGDEACGDAGTEDAEAKKRRAKHESASWMVGWLPPKP